VLELVEDNLGHHTNTLSKITECIVEVLISNGALYSGASWILFIDERCVQGCRTTFFGQLDDLYSWQRFLLIKDDSDVLGICRDMHGIQ
jgi:hypothetical protein